jgi:hypothetical protein
LLIVLVLITVTGTIALGGGLKQGPLAFVTPFSVGITLGQIHKLLALFLMALIVLHIGGVIFESVVGNENLARAMVTGRKAAGNTPTSSSSKARPVAAIFLFIGIAGGGAIATSTLAARPGLGVPPARLDPLYLDECGACHFAYPPSLAKAATWSTMLAGLSDHFGEDATLPEETAARLSVYLTVNSAEHWDTQAAHVFATMKPSDPLRLTASPFWTSQHHGIPEAVFASKQVGAKGACDACHKDAESGRFDPQQIKIPEGAHL